MAPRTHHTPTDAFRELVRDTTVVGGRKFIFDRPLGLDKLFDHPAVRSAYDADEYIPYWADLWPVHNEHRILFPRLVLLGAAVAFDLRLCWIMALGVLLTLATWLVLRRGLLPPPHARSRTPTAWALALAALPLFSLHAWGNWTWGIQIVVFACVAGAVTV